MDTITATTNPVLAVNVIDAQYFDAACDIVRKYNRRAERAGITEALTVVTSTATVPDREAERLLGLPGAVHEVITFVVLGKPLVIEGYEFVATLSFDAEAGVVTRPVPGATAVDLSAYRSMQVPVCDACNTRRARKDVYVLLAADGTTSVVGSNCLAAYIGLDPSAALRFVGDDRVAALLDEDSLGGGGRWEHRFPAETVVALASAAVAAFGWVAKSSYEGTPTVSRVQDCLYPLPSNEKERREVLKVRAAIEAKLDETGGPARAVERANEVLAWVRSGEVGSSEYAQNLMAVLGASSVSERNLGLAVSAVSSWAKAQDRAVEKAARAERAAVSEWVGQAKQRLELDVTLVQQPRFIEGGYGVSTLLVMADAAGNVFKWFASGSVDLAVGTRLVGKATVKKHEEYNGAKSTVITRFAYDTV